MSDSAIDDFVMKALMTEDEVELVTGEVVVPFFKADKEGVDGGLEVKAEQPWHRTLAHLLLQGYSNKDAAELLGKSPATVALVKRQPWFRNLLAVIAAKSFKGDFLGLLEGSAVGAIATLEVLATSGKNENVRASAAGKLLDAFLKHSKPRVEEQKPKDPKQRALELDREIEEAERALSDRSVIQDATGTEIKS
jgi:hypothetical protein